jgi:hypothetical protein
MRTERWEDSALVKGEYPRATEQVSDLNIRVKIRKIYSKMGKIYV